MGPSARLVLVDEFSASSERGVGGFGSTGVGSTPG